MTKARKLANFGVRFNELSDAPGSYVGQANKIVGVNPGETALEFKTQANSIRALTDTPSSFVGFAGAGMKVNAAQTAFEYGMQQPRFYKSAFGSEGGPSVLITLAGFTVWVDIFKIPLPISLAVGDLVEVEAQTEIRNDASFNVEFVTGLLISNNGALSSGVDIDGTGYYLGELNGHDVDPTMHYFDTPKMGKMIMPAAMATPYVYFRIRCRSTAAVGTDYATILPGYGHMSIKVTPKVGL